MTFSGVQAPPCSVVKCVSVCVVPIDAGGGEFTSIGDFNFTIAPGVADQNFGQIIDLSSFPEATRARLVRFNIKSNHGGDDNFVGLSEVRFDITSESHAR